MAKTKVKRIALTPVFYDPARDGVTFSLLSTFLACRERARLFLEGWSGQDEVFALIYGGIAHHILRAAYDDFRTGKLKGPPSIEWFPHQMNELEYIWTRDHVRPTTRETEMFHEAMAKNQAIMPEYFRYYKSDFDLKERTWLDIEQTFSLPWSVTTPNGRLLQTFLRGRMDASYTLVGKHSERPRLFETKTRSQIDEDVLIDTMPQERQLNTYLSVLRKKTGKEPVSAQLNIIRKPMLRQGGHETWSAYMQRIVHDVKIRPEWYFVRMQMTLEKGDIDRSEQELNQLIADFLLWQAGETGHYKNTDSCRQFNRLCTYVKVCAHGDYTGLAKRDVVFRELEDE